MKILKLIRNICSWLLFAFFLIMAIGTIPSYVTVFLMILLAILVMPIKFIKELWKSAPVGKIAKPIVIFLVFFGAIMLYQPADSEQELPAEDPIPKLTKEPEAEPAIEQASVQVTKVSDIMQVHFIDVGQGDAALITCGEEAMLIDAGDNSMGTTVQKYLMQQGIDKLEYVIATHPDADHIGGLDVIIYKFDCEMILMPDAEKDTESYQDVLAVMENQYYQKTVPKVGDIYTLGSANFQVISPALTYAEANNNSIVIRLVHGDNSFLFTGDAEVQAQQEMTYGGYELHSDVIKIPHHGGSSSYQKWFYQEVKPAFAVISCGKDNGYGHPSKEVLEALKELGVSVYRTDEQGSIVATSDGKDISWNTSPSVTWAPGVIPPIMISGSEDTISDVTNNHDNEVSLSAQEAKQDKSVLQGTYAVNGKNGKIHIVGACTATKPGSKSEMKYPIYFNTYEEAEAKSVEIDGSLEKRKCGNCW